MDGNEPIRSWESNEGHLALMFSGERLSVVGPGDVMGVAIFASVRFLSASAAPFVFQRSGLPGVVHVWPASVLEGTEEVEAHDEGP